METKEESTKVELAKNDREQHGMPLGANVPVSGLLVRFLLTESVRKPFGLSAQAQRSVITW